MLLIHNMNISIVLEEKRICLFDNDILYGYIEYKNNEYQFRTKSLLVAHSSNLDFFIRKIETELQIKIPDSIVNKFKAQCCLQNL